MTRYLGLVDGEAGAYGIVFPDLPGCTSMGDTVEDTIVNGADALRLWAKATLENDREIPDPRPFEDLRRDEDVSLAMREGATLVTVPLVLATGSPTKANLSIDAGILEALDAEAKRRRVTRSALVEAMAREMLPKMT